MASLPAMPEPEHALIFPFPVVGHINPMLQLASSLCSGFGIKVTFLMTEYRLLQMAKESKMHQHELFSFYAFPDGLSAEDYERPMAVVKLFEAMGKMAGSGLFESVMQDLQSRGPPVSCIISDTFFSWTQFVAEKLGIPRVAFWTSCASSYLLHHYTPLLIAQGHLPLSESNDRKEMLELPGIGPLPADKIPTVMQASSISDIEFNAFLRFFENDRKCAKLIINSYIDLEPEQFKVLKKDFSSVITIGPLLPADLLLKKPSFQGSDNNRTPTSKEDRSCLQWLDSKPAASVLYVSFGSLASLGKEELHELAFGLESSKTNFLWVIRGFSALDDGGLPKGFLKQIKEHCLIVSWAPQLEVLAHPSVGGFLTHCGWNSVIESLSLGVPLIGMPTDFAEQKMVAWFIEHKWKVGVQLKMDMKGLVCQTEVAVAVKAIMEGEEAAVYRRNARKVNDGAKKAIQPGGSSQNDLQLLAQYMSKSGHTLISNT